MKVVSVLERARSIRQLPHARQHESLNVAARLEVPKAQQCVNQRIELRAGDLAGAVEEIVLAEEIVGFLHVFLLKAANLDENLDHVVTIALVVEIRDAPALDRQHAL